MCDRDDGVSYFIVHITVCFFRWHVIVATWKSWWRRWKFFMLTHFENNSHAKFHMKFNVTVK